MSEEFDLERRLGYNFSHKNLLKEALTHSSVLNEPEGSDLKSNQRLAYLGDAVISLIIAETFFKKIPEAKKGDLTEKRKQLVDDKFLARVATRLNLNTHLILGRGSERMGIHRETTALAEAFEALVGAIYLDDGIDKAKAVVLQVLKPDLESLR